MSSGSTDDEDDLDGLFHIGQYVLGRVIESASKLEQDKT